MLILSTLYQKYFTCIQQVNRLLEICYRFISFAFLLVLLGISIINMQVYPFDLDEVEWSQVGTFRQRSHWNTVRFIQDWHWNEIIATAVMTQFSLFRWMLCFWHHHLQFLFSTFYWKIPNDVYKLRLTVCSHLHKKIRLFRFFEMLIIFEFCPDFDKFLLEWSFYSSKKILNFWKHFF